MKTYTQCLMALAFVPAFYSGLASAEWGVGIGLDNYDDIYQDYKDDARLTLDISHRGERFNMYKNQASFRFIDTPSWGIEAYGLIDSGYETKDKDSRLSEVLLGMEEREAALNLGSRAVFKTEAGDIISLALAADVTNRHRGQSVELCFGCIAFFPQWSGEREFIIQSFLGGRWQSEDKVDYYYGVKASEATVERSQYTAGNASSAFTGIQAIAQFSKNFTLESSLIVESVPEAIRDSPITRNDVRKVLFDVNMHYWF